MDYTRLRAAAMSAEDEEEAVTVDTRALIDKVLARYSGEWTTLRELIQNAADAQATTVKVKWETLPSTQVPVPAATANNQTELIKHTLCHHTLQRLVVTNNGMPFTKTDWGRLKKIAEGNPDETKIGAFGVGFYSVFADCEEPFVSSGQEAMAFYWKANALFTRKVTLPAGQGSPDTSFVLDYRSTTTPLPNLLSVSQFLATSLTFVALQNIEFWIDDWKVLSLQKKASPALAIDIPRDLETRTKEGIMRLTSADRTGVQIDATFMSVIGWKPQASTTGTAKSNNNEPAYSTELPSLKSFFSRLTSGSSSLSAASKQKAAAAKEEKAIQDSIAEDLTALSRSVIFLRVTSAQIAATVGGQFAKELERATKKPPPKAPKISILTSSYEETLASSSSSSSDDTSNDAAKIADVFASVLPSKKPGGGRIFIGFPTTQTTGGGMHISAPSVIPTVEREAIDLNARWVRSWNMEMLRAAGVMSRLAFADEMAELDQKLRRMSGGSGKKKDISAADVQKCIPEALHILKTYTFQDSTPSSQVSQVIEEAFWTAWKRPVMDVFSSRGVLSTSQVRTSSDEIAKFVAGIPVVLEAMKQDPFIQRLIDFGLIKDATVQDICQELGAKALDRDQLVHFLQWITKGASTNKLDPRSVQDLLGVAVATIPGPNAGDKSTAGSDVGEIIALGTIRNYPNNKIPPALPFPPTTIPMAYIGGIPETSLQALGWQPLGVVDWLRFLIQSAASRGHPDAENLTKNDEFALRVLTVLSKNWDNLSQSSKASVVSALQELTVMPTKAGMRKPAESFFPTVKLFDDLPTLQGCAQLKDKFLVALGVRKTVDLDTIFTRLLSPAPTTASPTGDNRPKWSHMELIKYLASVQNDIPSADMTKLRGSPLCPAEAGPRGMEPTRGSTRLYRVSELYEPKDSLRVLGLPILHWPGPPGSFRSGSVEARFLYSLGLRPYPSVPDLVDMMASPGADKEGLRTSAMQYFLSNHRHNEYSHVDLSTSDKCFLPLEEKQQQKLVSPRACYTNERAAVLGYSILRRDLHVHADKLGVARDPPMPGCVERLIAKPPRDRVMAVTLFAYFRSRLGEIGQQSRTRLRDAAFVPIFKVGSNSGATSTAEGSKSVTHVRPAHCYLGSSATYQDIFDFVDFGVDGNAFLAHCGAKTEPSKHEIAQMACSEPARLLSVLQSPDKYLGLLRSIAEDFGTLKGDRELVRKMKTNAWLLGFREVAPAKSRTPRILGGNKAEKDDDGDDDDDTPPIKHYQLAKADEMVILDDYISYRLFKDTLLCAPEDDQLELFYTTLGAATLGSKVKEDLYVGQRARDQRGADWLRKHVLERSKLFLHEYAKDKLSDAVKHDAQWLDKNLQVIAVSSLGLRRSLRAGGLNAKTHQEKRSAASQKLGIGYTLYVADNDGRDNNKPDMYQVGMAICQLLLARPNQQAYFFFEPFLKLGLLDLRARGYNVDRILRAKAAEARLAEEERRKALEAEQARIRERQKEWAAQEPTQDVVATTPERPKGRMPGSFDDSPEHAHPPALPEPQQHTHRPRWPGSGGGGGLFSNLSRRLGFSDDHDEHDNNGRPSSNSELDKFLPPPSPQGTKPTSPTTPKPPNDDERVTSPATIQQNLLNAIRSTRAHDSTTLFAPPNQTTVQEQTSYCDSTPAQNLVFAADAPRGMRVFLDRGLSQKYQGAAAGHGEFITTHAEGIARFETLLRDVAGVYGLSERTLHIFCDERGGTVAFNRGGSVFCNLRFWEQLHGGRNYSESGRGRVEATTWWWVVVAHELAHNLVSVHGSEHSYYSESFVQQYFPKMMAKAAGWLAAEGTTPALASASSATTTSGAASAAAEPAHGVPRVETNESPPPYSL
ncbi:heat shock cognate 90 kDa protein [Dichotomopilus funicola]|uniref:Heat shock cognate 90 kDa protein n=1 Tax=Dichotomopilus funicola TaxID=1934379 RepID=A0AAN6VB42_9PEZI|nr:heat shock cognate 90 kDa protein [Dichotomopilus funicola]